MPSVDITDQRDSPLRDKNLEEPSTLLQSQFTDVSRMLPPIDVFVQHNRYHKGHHRNEKFVAKAIDGKVNMHW